MAASIRKLRCCPMNVMPILLLSFLFSCRQHVAPEDTVQTITILGGLEREQQTELEAALRPFEERTGVEIHYEGDLNFATLLSERVEAGNPPDIVIFPQPALIAEYAESGHLVPLTNFLDERSLQAAYSDKWLNLGAVNGNAYALWYRAIVKSLVWYRPSVFEAQGYRIPTNWDNLTALSNQIVKDGGTPWCIGLESAEATGWGGTDWIEAILLRTAGPESYRQWVARELPFESPQVIRAFKEFGTILHNPDYVSGGALDTITMPHSVSPLGLFDQPPSCYMHQQGSFISLFFPESFGEQDYDVFLLPEIEPEFETPILVSGDAFGVFNHTPEIRQFMTYMLTTEPHEIWAKQGGFVSPHQAVSPTIYPDPMTQKIAAMLLDANEIYFDASDMMDSSLGLRPFWIGIVDFAAGKSAEEVTRSIDEQWLQD